MYGSGIGDAFEALYKFGRFSIFVLFPLALWKLIDIFIWVFHHVKVSFHF